MRNLNMNSWTTITRTATIFITILLLTACGGGGGAGESGGGDIGAGKSEPGNGGGSGGVSYGTATLSWLPPTENTDGSTLTTLAGYKIYYGTSEGNYTETISIDNPGLATYVIENLPAGNTYYFVITAIDSNGIESAYSTVGSKTIPA